MNKKIEALEEMARTMVGDGKSPNLFFVCDEGVVVTVTRNVEIAYAQWRSIACSSPRRESSLEDRQFGTIASIEPKEEGSTRLVTIDDYQYFLRS